MFNSFAKDKTNKKITLESEDDEAEWFHFHRMIILYYHNKNRLLIGILQYLCGPWNCFVLNNRIKSLYKLHIEMNLTRNTLLPP